MTKVYDEYEYLYHYTNWDGLDGILKSQSFWAKNYKYLNDEKEIHLFMENRLPEFLFSRLETAYLQKLFDDSIVQDWFFKRSNGDIDKIIAHDVRAACESLLNPLKDQIYITSFSGETKNKNIDGHGLLSQWRAYGEDGGYCLILNTKNMVNLMNAEGMHHDYAHLALGDIVYSDDQEKYAKEFSRNLDIVADFVVKVATHTGKKLPVISNKKENPMTCFLSCITRYKHFGFKEENEVRLVAVPNPFTSKDKKRKSKEVFDNSGVPFIDIFSELKTNLPIEKIIIGPHKDKIKRAEKLAQRLKDTKIEILVSDIPFVGSK